MPKRVKTIGADDRYNLMLGLIAYLLNTPTVDLSELEKIFKVDKEHIRAALHTINHGGFFSNEGLDSYPFWVDPEALDEDDLVLFSTTMYTPGPPRISQTQAAALATGLMYLRTLPNLAGDPDIIKLQSILASLEPQAGNPVIDIKPGTIDEIASLVLEAINARRRISLDYINRSGESSTREIEPVKLIESDGHLAVLAWCLKSGERRNFRIDRMSKVQILPGSISAEAKEMFDNIEDLSDNSYNPGEFDHDVIVEVTPEAYSLVSQFTVISEPKKVADGVLRVSIKVGKLEHLGKLIAKYGGAAKVVEPANAREIVRDYALMALGQKPLAQAELSLE